MSRVHAELDDRGRVSFSMSYAEAVAIREVISFADFDGVLPARDPAETEVVSRLLASLDGLIPELGSDAYSSVVDTAWREINAFESGSPSSHRTVTFSPRVKSPSRGSIKVRRGGSSTPLSFTINEAVFIQSLSPPSPSSARARHQ